MDVVILADHHARTGEWVRARIPKVERWLPGFKTIRAEVDGQIVGAVVFDGFTPFDVCIHIALDDPKAVNRRTLRAVFAYPFYQLRLRRVTALIGETNSRSIQFVTKIGFWLEGRKRQALGDEDELIYGLTREACRFL